MREPTKRILFIFAPAIIMLVLVLVSSLWPGIGPIEIFVAAPLVAVATFVIYDAFFLREDYLKRWTKAHGVAITDDNREVVHRYLRRGRRFRAAGGFLGFATYNVVVVVIANDEAGIGWLRAVFGGYLLGAALAEFLAFRPQPAAPRAAALAPRRVNDYISSKATFLTRAVTLATVALIASWQFIPRGPGPFPGVVPFAPTRPDFGEALVWGGVAVLLLFIVEATTRRIVHRPQPASSEGLAEADDAIRSTGMHAVVGAGLALQFGILGGLSRHWSDFTEGGTFNALFGILPVLCAVAAVLTWLRLGIDQPWIVRRTQRRQEAVA